MKSHYMHEQRLESLTRYVRGLVGREQFAGIAWCVEHQGEIASEGFCGFADHALSRAIQSDTLYRVYSMTKPIVSVCALQLIETGQLKLDDPISQWIPSFADQKVLSADGKLSAADRPITIEDLLTHRSGLSYDFIPDCQVARFYQKSGLAADGRRPLKELVALLADYPLACQPGERWLYSYSTDVLAHILEHVCDQSLADCLQQRLFSPLDMQETGFSLSEDKHSRVADMFGLRELGEVDSGLHESNTLRPMNVEESYPLSADAGFSRGGIGLYCTMSEYRRFMSVLMCGQTPDGEPILSAPMLDLLWQNRLASSQMPIVIGNNTFAGYGWGLTGRVMCEPGQVNALTAMGEGGWAGAASTYFWIDRRYAFSGIVMAQFLGSAVPLGSELQTIAYGALTAY